MRLPIALLLVTLTSCVGDDDGDPSQYVAVTQLSTASKDAVCTHFASCGLFPTKDACLGADLHNLEMLINIDDNVVAAIGAGRVYYNGSNVKACFDAYAAMSCDITSESYRITPDACRNIISGTVIGGEACTIGAECISQQCSTGNQGTTCAMGTCVGDTAPTFMPAQIGDACTSTSTCVAGAYCDSVSNTCVMLKAQGETCMLASECAYGLSCVGQTGSRTCGTLPGPGESCSTGGVCRDQGNFCNFTTGNCEQVGTAGATCMSSTQCSMFYPCDGVSLQCKQGPGLGEPCDQFAKRCFAAGTYCDNATLACTALKSNGMPCQSDSECSSDYCDQTALTPVCGMPTVCF